MTNTINFIENLKASKITLKQVAEEIDYRDKAGEGSRWDNDLYDYSTEELVEIESNWKLTA